MLLRLSIFSPLFLRLKHIQTTLVSEAARHKNPALTGFPLTHCHDLQDFMGEQSMLIRKSELKTEIPVLFFPRLATSLPHARTDARKNYIIFIFCIATLRVESICSININISIICGHLGIFLINAFLTSGKQNFAS